MRKKIKRRGNTRWLSDHLDLVQQKTEELTKMMGRDATMSEVATALTLEVGGKFDFTAKNIHDAKYNLKRAKPLPVVQKETNKEEKTENLSERIDRLTENVHRLEVVLQEIAKHTGDISAATALMLEKHEEQSGKVTQL